MIELLESSNQSMNQANRSLKEELASYKNIEKKIQLNYHKINQAENLKVENAKLVESLESARENLQGQINQSVSLASSVTQLNRIVDEILFLQETLAKQGIPGCFKESYVSPQDGQEYQGVKGIVKLVQDLVSNNDFNLKTT
jgi:small ligand-binding sensory domain FIST